jgi:hypothetical protein
MLRFIIDTLVYAKCYEWVFLLAIVLKKFTILNEIMSQYKTGDLPEHISTSLDKGLTELDSWSINECCGYRSIVNKLRNMM